MGPAHSKRLETARAARECKTNKLIAEIKAHIKAGDADAELIKRLQELYEHFESAPAIAPTQKAERQTWKNVMGNVVVRPLLMEHPSTLSDVMGIHKLALEQGLEVKAVGTGHSYCSATQTSGILVQTHKLNTEASAKAPFEGQLPKEVLKEGGLALVYADDAKFEGEEALYCTQAGVTIHDLNRRLEQVNLALENMGGAAFQTLAGYCSTSTHGSGAGFGPVCDGIMSMVLVTTGALRDEDEGKSGPFIYRIERTEGITCPRKYEEFTGNTPTLIQNDDLFHSATTMFGTMGIIYSLVIKTVQFYWLEQTAETMKWSEVRPLLQSEDGDTPALLKDSRCVTVYFDPYPQDDNDFKVVLFKTKKTKAGTKMKRSPLRAVEIFFQSILKKEQISYDIVKLLMNAAPEISPTMLTWAMKSQAVAGNTAGKWYDVLNIHMAEDAGFASEWAFPLTTRSKAARDARADIAPFNIWPDNEAGQGDKEWTLEHLDKALYIIGEEVKRGAKLGQYANSPMGVRFVHESPSHMSMMHGTTTATIELDLAYGTFGAQAIFERIGQALIATGGRFHWGLNFDNFPGHNGIIRHMYPAYDKFTYWMAKANARGTYSNKYTRLLGFPSVYAGKKADVAAARRASMKAGHYQEPEGADQGKDKAADDDEGEEREAQTAFGDSFNVVPAHMEAIIKKVKAEDIRDALLKTVTNDPTFKARVDALAETWTAGHEYYNTSAFHQRVDTHGYQALEGKEAGVRAPEAGFGVKAAFMGQLLTRRLTAKHPAEEMPHQVWVHDLASALGVLAMGAGDIPSGSVKTRGGHPIPGPIIDSEDAQKAFTANVNQLRTLYGKDLGGLTWACYGVLPYGGKNTGTVFSPAFNSLWVFRDAKDGNSIKVWICTAAGARGKPSFPYVGFGTETTRSKAGIRFHPLSSEENLYSISLQDQPLVLEINAQYAYLKDPAASPYLKISVLIEPATKKQIDAIVNVGDLVAKATAMVALMHKAELVIQIYQQYFPDMDFSQVIYNTENDLQAAHVGEGKSFKDRLLNSIQADLAGAAMASVTDLLSKDKLWVVKPQLIKESDATEE